VPCWDTGSEQAREAVKCRALDSSRGIDCVARSTCSVRAGR
jgi:hypothetical protein